jgi:LL-diaminopimelate aminotransferase
LEAFMSATPARPIEARRLQQTPPYLFADLDRKKEALQKRGVDVISLAVGDPDLPTPSHIVEAMQEAASDAATHQYPPYAGTAPFRAAAAQWFQGRFGVALDPAREVLGLIGSKEGIAHLPWATVNPGDVVLVPDPAYPVYHAAAILADGAPHAFALSPERNFLPDLDEIPTEVARKARLMFLNYPNNPTGAIVGPTTFADVVRFARDFDIIVAHDNSYSEIAFDGYRPPSFLETEGAKDVGVEFHSLSKTYCMTGWRIGYVAGNADVLAALAKIKTNLDSGQFVAIQRAGEAALRGPDGPSRERVAVFRARRDRIVPAMQEIGLRLAPPKASLYLWAQVPDGHDSVSYSAHVLEQTGVVVTPGLGYGEVGRRYIRISLTTPDDRLDEAISRLRKLGR